MSCSRMWIVVLALASLVLYGFATSASASHAWGAYHWARASNPLALTLGDNLSLPWKPFLVTTSADWSVSAVVDTTIVAGTAGRACKPTPGRAEVCNSKYGNNGWLGIATIWASGNHITQATVRMNDTYFSKPTYNTPAWKNLVMCQEVGHVLGLDHQDENMSNANLGTCMDYTNNPSTNQHPNQHDYDMLQLIYAHVDAATASKQAPATAPAEDTDDPKKWGKEIARSADGRVSLYEQDLGHGTKVYRHVLWAEGESRRDARH